jgi:tRNA-specific 2-thiouridylase
MKNWHDDSTISNDCPWLEDSNDALLVAEKLGTQTVDLSEEYKEKSLITCSMNEKGRTQTQMCCNREIKLKLL